MAGYDQKSEIADEGLIESGIGFIEEIHIFISYKPPQLASLLSRLETICCPFPVTIFTPTSIHCLPSSASKFIDNPNTSKAGHGLPVTISSSRSSPAGVGETVKSNGPGESKRQSGSENKKGKERQEEGDRPPDRPEDEGDHGLDPGLDGDGGEKSWMAEISFDVSADLLEPEADSPFQSLATTGKIMITVWLCFFKLYFLSHKLIANPRRSLYPPKVSNMPHSIYGLRSFKPTSRKNHDAIRCILHTFPYQRCHRFLANCSQHHKGPTAENTEIRQ